jgi:MoxR-like ATPase
MPRIRAVAGPLKGISMELADSEVTLGRDDSCQIVIPDELAVSRKHARLAQDANGWILTDLHSLNGVRLNRDRMQDSAPLKPGDRFSIGSTLFEFQSEESAPPNPKAAHWTDLEGPDANSKESVPAAPALSHDEAAERLVRVHQQIRREVSKFIVGQNDIVELLLIAILAGGHCLLEGVPGLAKTALIRTLAQAMQLSFRRIQFTPDLMPADITGTDILQEDPTTGHRRFVFQKGPLFTQMLLADEINRTPAKTQAALLEAMQEHAVTAGGHTLRLETPFFVLATQNPIEQEGTYPLPEAQKDRFLFHLLVTYPNREEEREVIRRTTSLHQADIEPVVSGRQILEAQSLARQVPVPDHVMDFVLDLVRNTRPELEGAPDFIKELVSWGAGPRACQCLVLAGKVRALLQGRLHMSLEDAEALALPVLRHRIVPTFHAESEGISADAIIRRLIESLPRPVASAL